MQLVQISAWNDSGGGFLHRLFDGHSGLDVWPFELLLGNDALRPDQFGPDWFRGRFRWPRLTGLAAGDGAALFDQIGDYELKSVLADPAGAKHRDFPVGVPLAAWREAVAARWADGDTRDQAGFLTAYVRCFFELWPVTAGWPERMVLGHCPIAVLDAPEIWADFPSARIIHVVRSPLAGFADMRRRHPALEPGGYARKWSLINGYAAALVGKYPKSLRLVRFEDLLARRVETMRGLCAWLGVGYEEAVTVPSWCGRILNEMEMGPFGGVPEVGAGREARIAGGLDPQIRTRIEASTQAVAALLEALGAGEPTGRSA